MRSMISRRTGLGCPLFPAVLFLLLLLLPGCSQTNTSSSGRYGGSLNHVHDVLVLRGVSQTVLLATHIGLYRTANGGASWQEVAGGSGQVMDGLMLFKLAESPVDPQRVYVLAVLRPDDPQAARATPGLYTSSDAGRTWALAAAASAFPAGALFTISAGANGPGEVFVLLPSLGNRGVYVSQDMGRHWQPLSNLPTTDPAGIWSMPLTSSGQQVERLFLWSLASGLFESDDGGVSWSPATGVTGGIFSFYQAGDLLYANGDNGLYVSSDAGLHFTLARTQIGFSAVVACSAAPEHAYGLTGTTVYVSSTGGQTWAAAQATSQHPGVLAADPANPDILYVGLSYPLGIIVTTNAGHSWHQVLP
jgi:hypothetical protein